MINNVEFPILQQLVGGPLGIVSITEGANARTAEVVAFLEEWTERGLVKVEKGNPPMYRLTLEGAKEMVQFALNDGGLTFSEVVERTGLNETIAGRAVGELVRDGKIVSAGTKPGVMPIAQFNLPTGQALTETGAQASR